MTGIFPGTFDFLHPGHLRALTDARRYCDHLIVALQVDASIRPGKHAPVFTPSERYIMLMGCKYVDEVIPYGTEEELIQLLHYYAPCRRFVGADWADKEYTGKGICEDIILSRGHQWSSSEIRSRLR